ncbi:lytic transglycosylase domain-containing protein [Hoyosella sp. YIM 151337]|uniref:lytic transglycosylase domain-containing protein n=1 Tax=Hoyosella sp. YIM 151337 TaxID=2992742 RepID=UPI002235EC54|nr:lytic transglycosylase domain-containing protein [Hoyosella sp. YIM 151337]MCW4354414.1 lytic transglycosylase domain-containing protein [Hoyosella sp. YIM 151337]
MKRMLTVIGSLIVALGTALALTAPASANTAPTEYVPWLQKSAQQCSGITASLLAAQIHAESDFRKNAVSRSNAQGPAQFIPSTWAIWGVDADGDGKADPFSIPDAVTSQGRFMCHLLAETTAGVNAGRLRGHPLDLAIAGYHAGLGAVTRAGGMPSGGKYTTETQPYVQKIRMLEPSYRYLNTGGDSIGIPAPPLVIPEELLDFGSLSSFSLN